jgi:Type II CAAX prenyl endopeptidase Rce1-like
MGLTGGYRTRGWFANWRDREFRYPVGYIAGARHPWPCLVFLVPLLAAYELGVWRLSGPKGESLRAGVELWLREWLAQAGSVPPALIPAILGLLLGIWTMWRWSDRPERLFTTVFGIALEGVIFGLVLWAVCLNAPAILDQMGLVPAAVGGPNPQLVTYVGVGVYEEVLFRLIGFAWLSFLLRAAFVPWIVAVPVAVVVSAAGFALAHHFVQTDPFVPSVFLTRMLIGAFCAVLFWLRGLGVAIGAHIVYDIVVGTP